MILLSMLFVVSAVAVTFQLLPEKKEQTPVSTPETGRGASSPVEPYMGVPSFHRELNPNEIQSTNARISQLFLESEQVLFHYRVQEDWAAESVKEFIEITERDVLKRFADSFGFWERVTFQTCRRLWGFGVILNFCRNGLLWWSLLIPS